MTDLSGAAKTIENDTGIVGTFPCILSSFGHSVTQQYLSALDQTYSEVRGKMFPNI
jgi:hypothetical protein